MTLRKENEFYSIYKMKIKIHSNPTNYANALNFWKSVEEKYKERKMKWLEGITRNANSPACLLAAKEPTEESRQAAFDAKYEVDKCCIMQELG